MKAREKDGAFLGIDLHLSHLEIALVDKKGRVEVFSQIISWSWFESIFSKEKILAVAIDAPSAPNIGLMKNLKIRKELNLAENKWQDLRVCEYLIGIGGYYWTRTRKKDCPKWMQKGFELYEFFQNLGFKLASSALRGNLIEVFPTFAFRWILAPEKLLKKSTKKGLEQRIKVLKRFIPKLSSSFSSHLLDAIMASLLARFYITREYPCHWLGDASEGQILLPCSQPPSGYVPPLPKDLSSKWIVPA